MLKKVLCGAGVVAGVLALANPARADFELRLTDVGTGATSLYTSGSSNIDVTGATVGNFTLTGDFNTSLTGTGASQITSDGLVISNNTSAGNAAGSTDSLKIEVSENNFTLPGGSSSTMNLSNSIGGSGASLNSDFKLTSQAFADPGNTVFAETVGTLPPQSCSLTGTGALAGDCASATGANTTFTRSGAYSLTGLQVITLDAGVGNVSPTETLVATATPEPGSMLLLGTGLFGVARVARRRFNLGSR